MANVDLDMKMLMGESMVTRSTDAALEALMDSMENFSNSTTVKGTGNIFDCAISLGDLDFNINLDFFNLEPSKMDYILLKKIAYLRRLITEINNIFINLISDLECCTGDDRYNRTVVPIFKWLVEDENGLCGTLLRIAKDINKIYIPLKRILCLFRNVPGNPTIGAAGSDYLKYIYPMVDGLEKVMNLLDNGRFLDILIIPVKDFHDKLVACSNGKDTDFYTGYSSIKDIISTSIYDELTINLIDEIKRQKEEEVVIGKKLPTPPTPPLIDSSGAPSLSNYNTYDEFSKAMYDWNRTFSEERKIKERQYNIDYGQYLLDLTEYRKARFNETLNLNNEKFENSTFSIEMMVDEYKDKHRSICGCLGEIFRLDGYFVPSDYIIRNSSDLNGLIGEVEYRGIASRDYYMDSEEKNIKIINQSYLPDILTRQVETSFEETMKYPLIKDEFLQRISKVNTIADVINLNRDLEKEMATLTYDFRKYTNYFDSLNSSFYSMYLSEIESFRREIALYKNGASNEQAYEIANKNLYNYASYPPAEWMNGDKELSPEYQKIFGNISYKKYLEEVNKLKDKQELIDAYSEAYGRNHAVFKIVDNGAIECGCDLLCMVIKYIINLIMSIIKKLILFITKFITSSIVNKEMQWWIKFITEKIRCILDIMNLSKDLDKMEAAFKREMEAAKGTIQKAPESVANCSSSSKSIIDELNLYPEKAHVNPDTIKDITWIPEIYPNGPINTNVTPNFNNSFNIISDKIRYEDNNWKNRTIPSMILDCSLDYSVKVDWIPSSSIWKAFLNLEINIDQFNSNPDIPLKGNEGLTDGNIIENAYTGILYKLLNNALGLVPFNFRVETSSIVDYSTVNIETWSITSSYVIINEVGIIFDDIKKVWFQVQIGEEIEYVKVFDRFQTDNLKEFQENITNQLKESLEKLKETEFEIPELETTNQKYCSPSSLTVAKFEPVYNEVDSPLFPGPVTVTEDINGLKTFIYEPIEVKNNIPFLTVLKNGSGQTFTLVCLLDVCNPGSIMKTSYEREVDGVFLGGRYDYFELDAISATEDYIFTEKQLISKLRGYLENIGAISAYLPGPSSSIKEDVESLIDNTVDMALDLIDLDIEQNTSLANDVINNLPDGPIKNSILMMEALAKNIGEITEEVEVAKELSETYNVGITEFNTIPKTITKTDSRLGIPLMTLNEEENIILTIHEKKLKLININSNFGLDSVLETIPIDYKAGEQLFVEFSTSGFEHKISWLNERKIGATATIVSMNNLDLKPTQIGSFYKDGNKIALMCGKVNDIIFTESSRTIDDWYNNSNTYRPSGTIGYYDFSVFDGYHVYSVPEFFRVTKLNSLATVKGLLYESKTYSREEIIQKIQDGKYNEILSEEVTIVGERPISVGGEFIWANKKYYKNVTFGYLENFFCRDNLAGNSFTISFWLKQKDSLTNSKTDFDKKYILADTHNGNFIWLEEDKLHIQLFGQLLRTEPVKLLFIKDLLSVEPVYVEKWFHHIFKYDKSTANVYYSIECIDREKNFDPNYEPNILDYKEIKLPLQNGGYGKKLNFSLVTMLARFDVEKLDYTDNFWGEIAALAIWNEYKDKTFMDSIYNYQKRIIINEME